MIQPTPPQQAVLDAPGPLLVTGGPGSGKTTVALLKAAQLVNNNICRHQRVLFLSFARATVSRVEEAMGEIPDLDARTREGIEVETYHALFWRFLRTHGYLIGLPRRLDLLSPQAEAVALSAIRNEYGPPEKLEPPLAAERLDRVRRERERLAGTGRVCFDLFAPYVGDLLRGSEKLRRLFAGRYPVLILDEFQDTNAAQWRVIEALRPLVRVIAVADPEQRIFDFIGADPRRLDNFRDLFRPTCVHLSSYSHRSAGTEITLFGNDLLLGRFTQQVYRGVSIETYAANQNQASTTLVAAVTRARNRLSRLGRADWSLAVLVPTKHMARQVSGFLLNPLAGLPSIEHTAVIDVEGCLLAAELVAFALEPRGIGREAAFIDGLCRFFRGKGGSRPSASAVKTAAALEKAYSKYEAIRARGGSPSATSVAAKALAELERVDALPKTGNPEDDWLAVRKSFSTGQCVRLQSVASEARNLRLLRRGRALRDTLGELWRTFGDYRGSRDAVRALFVRQHLASAGRPEQGVVVMNMHKAKGKQFDEVVIFDGWPRYRGHKIVGNPDRILRGNMRTNGDRSARQNFRVSVTRAKTRATILTPAEDICALLRGSQ